GSRCLRNWGWRVVGFGLRDVSDERSVVSDRVTVLRDDQVPGLAARCGGLDDRGARPAVACTGRAAGTAVADDCRGAPFGVPVRLRGLGMSKAAARRCVCFLA